MVKFEAPQTGGNFVKKEEKTVLLDDETVMPVVGVSLQPNSFEPGEFQYILVVTLDGEDRSIGFSAGSRSGKSTSRDRLFDSLIAHFALEDAEPVSVFMRKATGSSFILVEVAEDLG